jgi:hypothetical protein
LAGLRRGDALFTGEPRLGRRLALPKRAAE